jgi:hypothetical protein
MLFSDLQWKAQINFLCLQCHAHIPTGILICHSPNGPELGSVTMPLALRRAIPSPRAGRENSIIELPLLSNEEQNQDNDSRSILTEGGFTPPSSSKFATFRFQTSDGEPSQSHEGVQLDNSSLYFTWCLFAVTTLSCAVTSYYAYNATLTYPNQNFIPSSSEWTMGILNTMTTVSAFLLGELVQAVFERVRWILASRQQGVQMGDFLGMSRATSIAGVLALSWGTTKVSYVKKSKMRKWIVQRYVCLPEDILIVDSSPL